jgi:hypothetical protein
VDFYSLARHDFACNGVLEIYSASIMQTAVDNPMTVKPLSRGKKSGPSRKAAPPGTKVSLGLRVTADTKARIDDAAYRSGRSQSEEATWRIERSFDHEDLLLDTLRLAYGEFGLVVLLLAYRMQTDGRFAAWQATNDVACWQNDAWMANPTGYDAAVQRAHQILEIFRPAGEIELGGPELLPDNHPSIPFPRHDRDIWQMFRPETMKRVRAYMARADAEMAESLRRAEAPRTKKP